MPRTHPNDRLWEAPLFWTEAFLVSNIAFLAVDILLAHAVNSFEKPAEWIPIVFSAAATLLLLVAVAIGGVLPRTSTGAMGGRLILARWIGLSVGWGAVAVGVGGLVLHLDGDFFQEETFKNLVYTAPFAAPLAYTGLGLLIILDRTVDSRTLEWARWITLLAAGGFAGNFVLSLADHAQNGFFYPTEWIGVVAGAIAVGFLIAAVTVRANLPLIVVTAAVMVLQIGVGIFGFYLHARGNLSASTSSLWERLIYGAPAFAPLLFADLAVLAAIGLWAMARSIKGVAPDARDGGRHSEPTD